MPPGRIALNQFAGLVTSPGLLQRNPASCIDVSNWEFPAPGVIRKRRGFARQGGNTGGPVWALLTSRLMGQDLLAHVGTTTQGTQLRFGDGSAALTPVPVVDSGTLTRDASAAGGNTRMKLAVCQRNHYLTAAEGIVRLESDFQAGSSARYAGMPRGQAGTGAVLSAGTNLGDGYARAYRVTWHRKDADGVELGGAPTTRWVVANAVYNTGYVPATTRVVSFDIRIPKEFGTKTTALTTAYFWRLWGTKTYLEASQLGDDEMFLISEAYLTAGQIAAGFVNYTDSTPDSYLGAGPTLHTNLYSFPVGEAGLKQGVVNEDAPPPLGNDLAYWQDCMWYADLSSRPAITVGLISNLANNDTVTVTANGVALTVTAKNAPAAATEFQIVTTAATNQVNVRETMAKLVACLNLNMTSGFSAHAITTNSTHPGLLYLELVNLAPAAGAPLAFTSSAIARWQGFDGYALGTDAGYVSQPNLLRYSKQLRADAVPPVNFLSVGNADSRILRIVPFRDRLLVFTDSGIFQVTGRTYADFSVFPFDLGFRLMAREQVAMCDQKVYAWCNEGIIEVDDGGVKVISTSIEPTIEALLVTAGGGTSLSAGRTAVAVLGFATAYRNQHQVRFHYCETPNYSVMYHCAFWLAFDTRTRTWTKGDYGPKSISSFFDGRCCSAVRFADDLLVGGSWSTGADTFLFLERRAYVANDFSDDDRTGGTAAITSALTMQYQMPDDSGAQHWQQTVLSWDAEEVSWRTLPSAIDIRHTTEGATVAAQTVAVSELSTRIEPPDEERRGQRMKLLITHSVAEYAGIVGISQAYRQGTRFAREVTP
jgi:hypothetical protein